MNLKGFKLFEFIFISLVFLLTVIKVLLGIKGFEIEIFVSCFVLSVAYMFFGFYLIGKPNSEDGFSYSILSGVIYSIGIINLLLSSLSLTGEIYFQIPSLILLLGLLLFHIYSKRTGKISNTYMRNQIVRCVLIIFLNLVCIIK